MNITSVNNELIKETAKLLQRKYRDETGLFILEGEKCIEEALNYGIDITHLFTLNGYNKFSELERIETTEAVLSKISSTTTAPKCVAVGKQLKPEWKNCYKRVVLLENIKDAGNLGTILRSACAFDVDAIILYGDTVDLYNPKCVRASVGNLWKVPVYCIENFDELRRITADYIPIGTLPKSNNTIMLNNFKEPDKSLIMFGTESTGLSSELINYAKRNGNFITIETNNKAESLNLSISVGIILYTLYNTNK